MSARTERVVRIKRESGVNAEITADKWAKKNISRQYEVIINTFNEEFIELHVDRKLLSTSEHKILRSFFIRGIALPPPAGGLTVSQ